LLSDLHEKFEKSWLKFYDLGLKMAFKQNLEEKSAKGLREEKSS